MPELLVIDRAETEVHLRPIDGVRAVEAAFRELGNEPTINHPRRRLEVYENGRAAKRLNVFVGASPLRGYIGTEIRLDHIPQAMEPGVIPQVSTYGPRDDVEFSAEGTRRVYLLFDLAAMLPVALLYGGRWRMASIAERAAGIDRTGATTAVGVKWLASRDAERLGFVGTGGFAPQNLAAILAAVPTVREVRVHSRSREHRERFCREMSEALGREIVPADDIEQLVRESHIVSLCTSSTTPVFDGEWLQPGTTVSSVVAMNSRYGQQGKPFVASEIDDATVRRSAVIVHNSTEQAIQDEQGTLWERVQRGLLSWDRVHELADVVAGTVPGRESRDQICLFHNNAGQGVADLACAIAHYEVARRVGIGSTVELGGARRT